MEDPQVFAPFIASRQRVMLGLGISGTVLLAAGAASLALDVDPTGKVVLASLLGVLGAVFGGGAILRATKPDPVVRMLEQRAADVVWISPTQRFYNGAHQGTSFRLRLADGSDASTEVAPKYEAEARRVLRTLCPDADFGFDSDLVAKHGTQAGADVWTPSPQGETAMDTLYTAVRKRSRLSLWFGLPTLAVAGLLLAIFIGVGDPFPGALAVGFGLVGAWLTRRGLRAPRRHPMVRLLLEDTDQVESIGVRYVSYGGSTEAELNVAARGGKSYMVGMPLGSEKPVLAELAQRVPHAFP